jgi:prophage regulatory protein
MAIWRINTCALEGGYKSRGAIYSLIRDGLWTEPVKLGARAVGWPDSEVKTLVAARIAGYSEADIRELVRKLHQARIDGAPQMNGGA